MTNIQPPPPETLPAPRTLWLWTVVMIVVAAAVVVVAVLPAERAIDVTGLGRKIRLTQMGEIKLALAMDAADHEAEEHAKQAADSVRKPNGK